LRIFVKVKKVKVGFLYSSTYTVNQNSALLQSQKWLLIGKSQSNGRAAQCGHPLHAVMDSSQTHHRSNPPITPGFYPNKHSPDGATLSDVADIRLQLTTLLSTSKG